MSRAELETLRRVLRALDADDDHRLDAKERQAFFESVRDPAALVARLESEGRVQRA